MSSSLRGLNNLTVDLLPHQVHALKWMLHREDQEVSGGILADDVGLGKTLSMISLIVNSKKQNMNADAGTLIICTPNSINQWKNEIKNKTKEGLLTVEIYHGKEREKKCDILQKKNVVISTFGIIIKERNQSPLFSLNWRRIILDDAHQIRNYKTKTAQAVCELSSQSRWAVTGTPIHNSEMDLYSFFKFLQYAPYDDLQKWKGVKYCDQTAKLVLSEIMLKCTQDEVIRKSTIRTLHSKQIKTTNIELNERERQIYDYITMISKQKSTKDFSNKNSDRTKDIKHKFDFPLLLRQMCCHPYLILKKLQDYEATKFSNPVNQTANQQSLFSDSVFQRETPSIKITKLLELLKEIISRKEKTVVVSQWISFLHLIAEHIRKENISFVCLTGKTANSERTTIVDNFNDPKSDTRVLLLSLIVGGVGLNIVGANHLVLMDLHWNPQLENQVQDRIYRIGQNKPVHIYKFLTVGTIEERIKDIQDKKQSIADSFLKKE